MNKRKLYILIALICLSLAGIIIVEFFWIRNAFEVREAQFNRSVNEAMGTVVGRLETRESVHLLVRSSMNDSVKAILEEYKDDNDKRLLHSPMLHLKPGRKMARIQPGRWRRTDTVIKHLHTVTVQLDTLNDQMRTLIGEIQFEWDNRQLERIDSIFRGQGMMDRDPDFEYNVEEFWSIYPGAPNLPQEHSIHLYNNFPNYASALRPSVRQFATHMPNGQPPGPRFPLSGPEPDEHVKKLTEKARRLQNILQKLTIESETRPKTISERVNKDTLDQLIHKALADKDIQLSYEFAVYSPSSDTNKIVVSSQNFRPENLNTQHRISLFPNDLITKPNQLLLFFPGQKSRILNSLSLLMVGSLIFTLVIVLTSGASIVVMIRQKKISDIKTDFINNMTHEFKTPIATISIAADSIVNSRVIQEPDKIRDFTRIIKEENNRMNTRVEQVLQMALLDSRDFKLRPVVTDMHSMIERAVSHYRLQIEKREGALSTKLEATNPKVLADEDHMRNVLMNLLDNANKYSGSRPEINVFSFNRGEKFCFGVEDHGTGMSQETQRRVFDKFFRVTSGNIHNVKGFGLGLSYVRAIVLAHHGEISLHSELGKGSRFEISLSYIPGQGEKVVYEGMKE